MLAYSAKDLVAKIPVVGALGGGVILAAAEGGGAFPFVEAGALAIIVGVLLNQAFSHQKRLDAASAARESALTEKLEALHRSHREELIRLNERSAIMLDEANRVLRSFQRSHPCALSTIAPETFKTLTQLRKDDEASEIS